MEHTERYIPCICGVFNWNEEMMAYILLAIMIAIFIWICSLSKIVDKQDHYPPWDEF